VLLADEPAGSIARCRGDGAAAGSGELAAWRSGGLVPLPGQQVARTPDRHAAAVGCDRLGETAAHAGSRGRPVSPELSPGRARPVPGGRESRELCADRSLACASSASDVDLFDR
jgi:hypothetical protein